MAPSQDTPTSTKLLLDTNIFRKLARGELKEFEQPLSDLAKMQNPPILWACVLSYEEIFAHITRAESDEFPHFRDSLRWMDQLCGNSAMSGKSSTDIIRATLVENCLPLTTSGTITGLNRARRRVIRANSFEDLLVADQERLAGVLEGSMNEKCKWVELGESLISEFNQVPKGHDAKHDYKQVRKEALDSLISLYMKNSEPLGEVRRDSEILWDLREHFYFYVFLICQSASKNPYNFARHKSDAVDRWFLAYPAAGYTLVTCDRRLRKQLKQIGCPEPIRVVGLSEAIEIAETGL